MFLTQRFAGLLASLGGVHHVVDLLTEGESLRLLAVASGIEREALPGAAIEVEGKVLVAEGRRSEAVTYLEEQARTFAPTSIVARIRKNRYVLPAEADLIAGKLSIHPAGYGFLSPETSSEPPGRRRRRGPKLARARTP